MWRGIIRSSMEKLRVYYPVKPFHTNQHFGENFPCVRDFGLPTQSIVMGPDNNTCPVGYEKLYAKFGMSGHNGTDLQAGEQNVYAACPGTVIEMQTVDQYPAHWPVKSFEGRMRCGNCGSRRVDVRPAWHTKPAYIPPP
jgi:hypothetical protein